MAQQHSLADTWLEEVLPEDLDWRSLAATYPRSCLVIASTAGFWLGVRHGPRILQAVADYAGRTVNERIDEFLGQER